MHNKIILLADYKGIFGSKQISPIYRGGMDIALLLKLFNERGYSAEAKYIYEIDTNELLDEDSIVLYTSSEDNNGLYKSFIEDVIYHLEEQGVIVLPRYAYLKAHNNKVAMEQLRLRSNIPEVQTINSKVFGTLEELKKCATKLNYPVVIKNHAGAMSRGVERADSHDELIKIAKKTSKSLSCMHDIKELLRKVKYRSKYIRESFYRNKFVVQNFIENLNNDWKVLVYSDKCFVLYRGNRKNDFRASGSGDFEFKKELPEGLLNYAYIIKNKFNVPHISLDIGYDGERFHLLEFQFIYFGTTTIEKAPFYFVYQNKKWNIIEEKVNLEKIYVESIVEFLKDNIDL